MVQSPLAALAAGKNPDAEVTRLAKESLVKYQAGDYTGAAELLLKAYEIKLDATLLFNAAKTYEKAGSLEQAIRFYQRVIDAEHVDSKLVKQASQALDRLRTADEERKAKERAEKAAAEDAARKAEADKQKALDDQHKAEEATRKAQEDQRKAEEDAKRAANARPPEVPPSKAPGAVLLGVGVVGVGAGVGLGLWAKSAESAEHATFDPITKPDLRSSAKTRALLADGAYVVGGACVAVGAILLVRALTWTPTAPPEEKPVTPAETPTLQKDETKPPDPAPTPAPLPTAWYGPNGFGIGFGGTL
jgi:tetratricopeptide (TPR) repeat protein